MKDRSSNFSHLSPLSSELAKIGYRAEQYLKDDPNTSLLKSRQFAELLTQETAARLGRFKLALAPSVRMTRSTQSAPCCS